MKRIVAAAGTLIVLFGCRQEPTRYYRCRACLPEEPTTCGGYFPAGSDYVNIGWGNADLGSTHRAARDELCTSAGDAGAPSGCWLRPVDELHFDCTSAVGPHSNVPIH